MPVPTTTSEPRGARRLRASGKLRFRRPGLGLGRLRRLRVRLGRLRGRNHHRRGEEQAPANGGGGEFLVDGASDPLEVTCATHPDLLGAEPGRSHRSFRVSDVLGEQLGLVAEPKKEIRDTRCRCGSGHCFLGDHTSASRTGQESAPTYRPIIATLALHKRDGLSRATALIGGASCAPVNRDRNMNMPTLSRGGPTPQKRGPVALWLNCDNENEGLPWRPSRRRSPGTVGGTAC